MEQTLSKDVQEKLDMINWDSLKDKYGISRDSFYNNPHLASQLAYGQMTDLVFAAKEDFSGLLSLRANMDTSGENSIRAGLYHTRGCGKSVHEPS